jgi:hypothetical protein
MKAPWQSVLRDLHRLGDVVEQFLQRPERTEPAAERPAPPEQKSGGDRGPEQENQRSDRKYSQLKPVSSELAKVRTLTTESWAFAYQPSQTE